MRRLTAIIITIVLTISVSLIYIPIYLESTTHTHETPTIPKDFVVQVAPNKFVFNKPLMWSQVFNLFLNGKATYKYLIYIGDDEIRDLFFTYAENINNNPCKAVIEKYGSRETDRLYYGLLLKDNCYILDKIFFGKEREWYPTLAVIPELAKKAIPSSGKYSIWTIIYKNNGKLVVEFYNILDPSQREAFLDKYKELVFSHNIVVVLTDKELRTWWYDDYKYLEKNNILYIIVFEVQRNTVTTPPLNQELEKISISYYQVRGIIYRNGVIRGIYIISSDWCPNTTGIICSENLEGILSLIQP